MFRLLAMTPRRTLNAGFRSVLVFAADGQAAFSPAD
jgi:hypothetical protein